MRTKSPRFIVFKLQIAHNNIKSVLLAAPHFHNSLKSFLRAAFIPFSGGKGGGGLGMKFPGGKGLGIVRSSRMRHARISHFFLYDLC